MIRIWIKRLLGLFALLIGLGIAGWFVYNQFWPTDEFKRGFRSIFQLIAPIACILVGWNWLRYQGKGIDEITPPDLKCQELEDATRRAQATLGAFIQEVEKGVDGALIKFPLHTKGGMLEHIWAYVHFYKEGIFNVTLVNEPVDKEESTDGRRNVPQADVEDWQIMNKEGQIRGAYSLIALFLYHEGRGVKLTPLMKKQKAQLLDA